jgi:prolyl-tRNA editing enzyme YbaK/EbsC (Cys-tRNA(Pro) deacylase)
MVVQTDALQDRRPPTIGSRTRSCTSLQDADFAIMYENPFPPYRGKAPKMSLESVRAFMASRAPDVPIVNLEMNSTTMTLSAAWGIDPAQIAKTLSVRVGERNLLLVTCGNSRLDNKKAKAALGGKVKMLPPDQVLALTGHPVGGVCPFGLATPLPVYFDISLRAFDEVVPAAGSTHAAMRINPLRMAGLVDAEWVDVCEQAG